MLYLFLSRLPQRFCLAASFLIALCICPFSYASAPLQTHIPDAKIVGSGDFSYLLWDLYDAALYAPNGIWSDTTPFALSLTYHRALDGHKIAKQSMKEISRLGFQDNRQLHRWYEDMKRIFPNVEKDTTLTGIYIPGKATLFYRNDIFIGSIDDAHFGKWFFGIWLDPKSSAPHLRAQLLALPQP